jgi:regulatory protein
MRLLARREHSRAELHGKLVGRGFENDSVKELLQGLETQDLLSDERFAMSLIASRAETGYGPNRIGLELRNRGISEELAREALAKAEVDWERRVTDQVARKFGSDPAETFPEWARRARYLERRGFSQDAIRLAIGNFERSAET